MDSISNSGDARRKLVMTGDTKDAKKLFFSQKTRTKAEHQVGIEFCGFSIHDVQTQKKIAKAKYECTAHDNIRLYSPNFGVL